MFCNNCGKENPSDSKYCSSCGKELDVKKIVKDEGKKQYNLSFFRESQFYIFNPPINVSVDNKAKFSIENGGRHEVKLEQGKHEILFYLSLKKKKIDIDIKKDTLIDLKWNRLTGSIDVNIE